MYTALHDTCQRAEKSGVEMKTSSNKAEDRYRNRFDFCSVLDKKPPLTFSPLERGECFVRLEKRFLYAFIREEQSLYVQERIPLSM